MHDSATVSTVLVVAAVLLFFLLGVAIMIVIDHKAKLPGGFTDDPFSITGMRRNHPGIAFVTATILVCIILSLIFELTITLVESLGIKPETKEPLLMSELAEQRSVERIRHFHNLPDQFLPVQGKKNICFSCHGDFPHSKEPMVRTMLNMHTQFVGCMTCHTDTRKIPEQELSLRWLNYSGKEVKGPPFGTDINSVTGELIETDDYYSKIVAYHRSGSSETLLEITADDPRMQEFEKLKHKLSDADKDAVKKRFHNLVSVKGRFCSRCHTDEDKSYVPFQNLGFSKQRTQELTNLNIIGLIEKYKDFYMPTLLKSDKSLPPIEVLTGPNSTKNKSINKMGKDPKSWWKEQYDTPAKTK
ncbi:MAG: hypothetical protein OEY67_02540 [Gammaproteobacteria bacterium]|nr:hypothetical protein [Gammaproteobacteria bacterium]